MVRFPQGSFPTWNRNCILAISVPPNKNGTLTLIKVPLVTEPLRAETHAGNGRRYYPDGRHARSLHCCRMAVMAVESGPDYTQASCGRR